MFLPSLERAIFRRRYQRFLADVELASGEVRTLHCPNSGSMKHCQEPGTPCWFSRSHNPRRRLPGTLELVTTADGVLAGIHSARANALVAEAIANGVIVELQGYPAQRREVRYGHERSRIDLLLESGTDPSRRKCFVEVKSVTLGADGGVALFPDAVTGRGARHLRELTAMVAAGQRAVLVFCVQRPGIDRVEPADAIDPVYGNALREAVAAGVEVLAYGCSVAPTAIRIEHRLPFYCL